MRKMFIAGAKCPQCEKVDKIFVYHKDGEDIAECNACGHISVRPKEVEQQSGLESSSDGVVKFVK